MHIHTEIYVNEHEVISELTYRVFFFENSIQIFLSVVDWSVTSNALRDNRRAKF